MNSYYHMRASDFSRGKRISGTSTLTICLTLARAGPEGPLRARAVHAAEGAEPHLLCESLRGNGFGGRRLTRVVEGGCGADAYGSRCVT